MKIRYNEDVDVRLRVAEGAGWAIPLHCRSCSAEGFDGLHWHVNPAVALGMAQVDTLMDHFGVRIVHQLSHGWLVPNSGLTSCTRQAEGITPEFYFKWDLKHIEKHERVTVSLGPYRDRNTKATEFLDQVSAVTGMAVEQLTMAWYAITQHAPGWLLSGNDLDLGFVRLSAIPYRSNWKDIVMARFPALRKVLLSKTANRMAALAFTPIGRAIRLAELTESHMYRHRPVLSWTVEVTRDSSWEKLCREIENEAAARLGPIAYMRRWASIVASRETKIYELLANKVAMDNAPACRILWKRSERGVRFVSGAPVAVSLRTLSDGDVGSNQSVDDFLGVEDVTRDVEAAVARMLEMPADGQADDVVRAPRGDDSGRGDSRVLVPHSDGGDAAGQGVLDGERRTEENVVQ